MISNATKRTILRWIHLLVAIPVLGYIYSPFAELPNYADVTRYVFAVIGVAVWLGAYRLSGIGTAILAQVAFFIASRGIVSNSSRLLSTLASTL